MRPIRYGQWLRWTDAYHGWRDGRAEVPAKMLGSSPPGPVTTPHREALIRLAQDAFAQEHLEYRRLVAGPHRLIVAERARLAAASESLTWAQLALDMESRPLTAQEIRRRRLGEEQHPDSVIIQRRRKDQGKLIRQAREEVTKAQEKVAEIEAGLEEATQEARQHHQAAVIRVRRIHEFIHRRLAVYRRSLIRAHPDGAWVNSVLSVRAPEIPGWALPDASYLPGQAPRAADPGPIEEPAPPIPDEPPLKIIELRHARTRFGSEEPKDPGGDGFVKLDTPIAAPWHFTIVKKAGVLELRTRGYGHGPYIDGEQVTGAVTLDPGDVFDFAERRYKILDAERLEETKLGKCDLVAADLFARSDSKVRLSDMSFVQREKTLLAVLGPSGAGKSSLFAALLGELPLESGRLFFQGLPMATHARQIRERLGFVPQRTDLHESLTVEATLRYGFGLRSPAGRRRQEQLIDRVLDVVKLKDQRGQLLTTLSGGQLRRVSIAMELLTDPPLLMLDEPTSGLDANMDRSIMTFLREHAEQEDSAKPDQSHTVIVVTHATEHLSMAHQILAVVQDGAPAYSGPPRGIRRHFGFKTYADLMSMLFEEPRKWADRYRGGRMVAEARREADALEASPIVEAAHRPEGRAAPALRGAIKRIRVLVVRQCDLLRSRALAKNARDRVWRDKVRNWAVVSLPLTVAAASAALAAEVATAPGLGAKPSGSGPTALTLLTTLCMLSGQALTYSDVVNELEIIRREFRAGVGAFEVLISKWAVYAAMAMCQAGLITVVFCLFPDRGPQRALIFTPEADLFFGLAAFSITAMTLGMLISTLAAKLEHAVALVTATSITQIALNGITSNLSVASPISFLAALFPDRWGLAAAASSVDLRGIDRSAVSPDALWAHSTGQWLIDLLALAALTSGYFVLATWRLRGKLRPQRGR